MRRKLAVVAAVIAVAGGITLWYVYARRGGPPESLESSGTVEATELHLGFSAAGRLESMEVDEGDPVSGGAEVARLDQSELLARRRQAQAQAELARAMLDELVSGSRPQEIRGLVAARDAARARAEHTRSELETTRALYRDRVLTQEVYDNAVLAHQLAAKQLDQAAEQLELAREGPRSERIEAQRHQVELAEAAVQVVDAALANTVIVTPIDGVVTTRHREPGEIVAPGSAVLTVMDPGDRWVRIYVAEDRIAAVRLGTGASITCDTYPDQRYRGEVMFIASEAEFTPKNVQTQKERVKLVYAVKVRILGDPRRDLKPGMPVDVTLDLAAPPRKAASR